MPHESHLLQSRFIVRVVLNLFMALFFASALLAEPRHLSLLREANDAARTGDTSTAIVKLARAAKFAPDYPRVHLELARLYAREGRPSAAIASLRILANMGLAFELDRDPAFDSLRSNPAFSEILRLFIANIAPIGGGEKTAWAVRGVTGIIEGVATHPTSHEIFLSDVRHRCVWCRDRGAAGGEVKKFSSDQDGLLGVFALKISADGRTLWATTAAVPTMDGYTESDKGRAFLVEYDLPSRHLRRTYALPVDGRDHVLGDFALAADGTVYVTDSASPDIWRLPLGGAALEKWVSYPWFVSLQGAAFSADGRILFVADYANGIWRINMDTHQATVLRAPAGSTLFGIGGLYVVSGALIAVQNGFNPQRILRIDLTSAGEAKRISVLAQDPIGMPDLALGQVTGDRFEFIGNSGWALFDQSVAPPRARTLLIHSLALHTDPEQIH